MLLFVPKETRPLESRVGLDPAAVARLVKLGAAVAIEAGGGEAAGHLDADYEEAGATIRTDLAAALGEADFVIRVRPAEVEEVALQKPGSLATGLMDPFGSPERIKAYADAGVSALCSELIPRTTLAQKMDVLSSQANLAGYMGVVTAAERLDAILPMMMTPAGTISPAKVFVIGVGVAGLQAIATARRLGARVEAFDTRPVVEEQVKSLGAKFVKIDIGETGETEQGYARELTPEQVELQRQGMAKICSGADIVVTTAKVFGRKAPVLLTAGMIAGMRPGSVVVDLAAEGGGNVEGTVCDEEVVTDAGVRIIGWGALEARVPRHASQMFAANIVNLIEHFWDGETFPLRTDDEIIKGCLLTHGGQIVHERFKPAG
ncbi:NAD(P) transhydrogenase subunit alpha [Haloferula sp. A504]|uniref:NAD(P) transhydrogenase subunit alpha n=1 Tax=Haloferula sp. A504 TaxID=3373601 RepID=UPI0031C5B46E|nr:NAD(P) transhydrogenase subunit alpha [Verrucomicrobiaceae bacterium E54]